jgi:hypothetical protein
MHHFLLVISYKENEGNLMVAIHKQYWQKCIPSFPLDHQSKTFSSALPTKGIQKTFPHTGKTLSQDGALIKRDSCLEHGLINYIDTNAPAAGVYQSL